MLLIEMMKATLEKILAVDTSRAIADIAIAEVEKNPELFMEAWEMTLRDEYPISMRAVRVVDECAERNPGLIVPFIDEMIRRLPEFKIDAVKRGFLRFLVRTKPKLSPTLQGYLVDSCFDFLSSASSSVAIRYYSLMILYEISKKEKSLKPELLDLIEDGILRNKFGNGSSVIKIHKKLYKEIQSGR
jgi:hypothetical protein